MARRTWNLLGVPIDSVGSPGGTELAPEALLAAGLEQRAPLVDQGIATRNLRGTERDRESGVVAWADVLGMSAELADEVAELADDDRPLLVLGGCCTLLPAVLGGFASAGARPRLVYVDAHLDLYDGETSPTGEAADMPLAVALGFGPEGWAEAAGLDRPLEPGDVWLLGPRDLGEAAGLGSVLPADLGGLGFADTDDLRADGLAEAGEEAARFGAGSDDGFWVHVDLDVLDPGEFPATDALVAGGLRFDELEELLGPLLADPACRGANVVCFNPEKDFSGRYGHRIAELLGATIE